MGFHRSQHHEMLERLIHIEGKIDRIEEHGVPIYHKFLGGGGGREGDPAKRPGKICYKILFSIW